MSRQFRYKVTWNEGNSAQLTNSKVVAARVQRQRSGITWEHNPFVDHERDEFGCWVRCLFVKLLK